VTFYKVQDLNAVLRSIPKEANATLRDASQSIAGEVAKDAASSASAQGGVAKYVAPTIRAARDRVPYIKMGSSKLLPKEGNGWKRKSRKGGRQSIGDVMWGAEFGGGRRRTTRQFEPWRGSDHGAGYFLWPSVRDNRAYIEKAYGDALNEAIDKAAT
jgi:hypothetical protein